MYVAIIIKAHNLCSCTIWVSQLCVYGFLGCEVT